MNIDCLGSESFGDSNSIYALNAFWRSQLKSIIYARGSGWGGHKEKEIFQSQGSKVKEEVLVLCFPHGYSVWKAGQYLPFGVCGLHLRGSQRTVLSEYMKLLFRWNQRHTTYLPWSRYYHFDNNKVHTHCNKLLPY